VGRRIALAVGLALLGVEVVTRVGLYGLSKDLRAFAAYPGRAAALATRSGVRVAVVGNSVAHEGVDATIFSDTLAALRNVSVRAEAFTADQSYVNEWHYMVKRLFWRPGRPVDLLVIPFWRDNLYDGNPIETGRLAQFFTTLEDWPEVLGTDLRTTAARAGFVASGISASFAARDRMQQYVFLRMLPRYREFARLENAVSVRQQELAGAGRRRGTPSLQTLQRFVRSARAHGTQVCFVAVPTLHPEWDDPYPRVRWLAELSGMAYVDLRGMPGVDAGSFVDRVHMNAAGRAALSRRLAHAVAPLVRCEGAACRVGSVGAAADLPGAARAADPAS
jgi:hypothetical protein